jgi:hypothetical protein
VENPNERPEEHKTPRLGDGIFLGLYQDIATRRPGTTIRADECRAPSDDCSTPNDCDCECAPPH